MPAYDDDGFAPAAQLQEFFFGIRKAERASQMYRC